MSTSKMKTYHLIFLRNSTLILSKKTYEDWQAIQTEFDDYMTSLNFDSLEEVNEFLSFEYNISTELIKTQTDKIINIEWVEIEI
jgi:hypothetical protein